MSKITLALCIMPSSSAIAAKMQVLTKIGREELGLVVTNGGLTMSCDYAKVLCKLAHRLKWTEILFWHRSKQDISEGK
jgi:hypothetical protein